MFFISHQTKKDPVAKQDELKRYKVCIIIIKQLNIFCGFGINEIFE